MQDAEVLSTVASEESDGRINGEAPVDHERLRYVTRLLGAQGGLQWILWGTYLFWIEEIHTWHWHWPRGWAGGLALLVGIVVFFRALQRWIRKYYQKRFGTVEPCQPSARQFLIFLGVILALLFFGQPFAHRIDPVISSFGERFRQIISDPAHEINLWPSLFWIGLFVVDVGRSLRSMERQNPFFLLCGALGFSSVALFAIWHPHAKQAVLWRALNAGGIGLSFIALGLYDYITLVRVLPKRVGEGNDE
jgi:hypothetical protein